MLPCCVRKLEHLYWWGSSTEQRGTVCTARWPLRIFLTGDLVPLREALPLFRCLRLHIRWGPNRAKQRIRSE